MIEAKKYDERFYDSQVDGSFLSAKAVVPIINSLVHPKSVLDVGCGVGTWLRVWKDQFSIKDIKGIDGEYVNLRQLIIPNEDFIAKDLKKEFNLHRKFDLVMCLEVGEHLPREASQILVDNLVNHGDIIIFSSANLHQRGTYHINEQAPEFWAGLFSKRNFIPVDILRNIIWNNDQIEWWYRQNILIYVNPERIAMYPQLSDAAKNTNPDCLFRIHPLLWKYRNEELKERSRIISFINWKLSAAWKKISKK